MKKSAIYRAAMIAVLEMDATSEAKLMILEVLMNDKASAEWQEKREGEKHDSV